MGTKTQTCNRLIRDYIISDFVQSIIDYIDVCPIIDCNQVLYNMLHVSNKKSTTSMLYLFKKVNDISSEKYCINCSS